jgi:selenocysteine lyase/cysteine desulfurase
MFTEEYPSLVKAFEERDFHVHKIKMQPLIEQAIEKRLAQGDIDVLALSIVQFASGLLIDIKFLKKIKKEYPNLILVGDGTQFLGGHNFNFDSSPFDIVAASGYKWLLAGFGNGVMMISEVYLNAIQKKSLALFNLIFNGHFNILATASLKFAIEAFEKNNFGLLMKKKEDITLHAKKLLDEYDLIDPWVSQRDQHSGIFIIKGEKDLHKKLTQNNIKCVPRGEGVRVSFHYYNTIKDLDRLLNVIKN